MADKCTWITFQAHSRVYNEKEEDHPEFFGVFVCPAVRTEPEQLLAEVLQNRKVFLVQITGQKWADRELDWGMNERLKQQIDEQGYGYVLTKMHARPAQLQ